MSDPYAQERAVAQANLDAEIRLERASVLEQLAKLTALVEALHAALVKPTKAAKD